MDVCGNDDLDGLCVHEEHKVTYHYPTTAIARLEAESTQLELEIEYGGSKHNKNSQWWKSLDIDLSLLRQEHWHIDLKAQLKYPIYSMAVHVRTYTIQHGDTLRLGEQGKDDWVGTPLARRQEH